MPPKFPWFPCYVSDWLGSSRIAAMTAAQEGAYHRLLCLAWSDRTCTLPNDPEALASMAKLPIDQLEAVLACFEPHPTLKRRLHNVRLTKEWETSLKIQQERSEHGKIGALKRWHGSAIAPPIAPPSLGNSILQSQSHIQKERKNLKNAVPAKVADRTTRGFESAGEGLAETVLKMIPKDLPS